MTTTFTPYPADPDSLVNWPKPPRASLAWLTAKQPAAGCALLYCDGACSGNGVKENAPGGWGAVLLQGGQVLLGKGGSGSTTNNRMELTAAIEGLRQLPAGTPVVVRTDSQYVIKGCTEWRRGWVRNGMKNSKGQAVANPDLWAQLWQSVDRLKVSFEWVRGHSGNPGNELADQLAMMGRPR